MTIKLKKSFKTESGLIIPRGKTGRVVGVDRNTGKIIVDFGILYAVFTVSPEDVE